MWIVRRYNGDKTYELVGLFETYNEAKLEADFLNARYHGGYTVAQYRMPTP